MLNSHPNPKPHRPEAVIYINEAQDLFMCNFNRLNETLFGPGECWYALPERVCLPYLQGLAAGGLTSLVRAVQSNGTLTYCTVPWYAVRTLTYCTVPSYAVRRPPELDWLGFDLYAYDSAVSFEASRNAVEWNLFSRMSNSDQSVC